MQNLKAIVVIMILTGIVSTGTAASFIVAPSNASDKEKAQADFVCDGKDDQVELLRSFTEGAQKYSLMVDRPVGAKIQQPVTCMGKRSVEWFAGDYYLDSTLIIPDAADSVIRAEGTYFHYRAPEGDAVVVQGAQRWRYYFGTIEMTASSGTALRIKPEASMPTLMSIIGFTGLIGNKDRKGIGLYLDSSIENVCTCRFEGTDIYNFDKGILVGNANPNKPDGTPGKTDTNWIWASYIRLCHTCIEEQNYNIDCNSYFVNVEACLPDSVAIRTGAVMGMWHVILGTGDWFYGRVDRKDNKTKSVIFEPGAKHHIMQMTPPVEFFAPVVDNSGNDTNVIMTTMRPPLNQVPTVSSK